VECTLPATVAAAQVAAGAAPAASTAGSSAQTPYPGYTGPRCYAPGGKTWRPC
jgi:micrococcal nuclease